MAKTITFRPLRRIKNGKITVASYSQWNRVKTADYHKFNLVVDDTYKQMPSGEYVYNHKGDPLFWRDYNPADIVIFGLDCPLNWEDRKIMSPNFGNDYIHSISYIAQGLDCQGTPIFSHCTMDYVASNYKQLDKVNEFDVLTVEIVRKWLGWFLYNLQRVNLKIGR